MDRTTYLGYFITWLFQLMTAITYFAMLTTAASLHMGMCFYINAMVIDLRIQLTHTDTANKLYALEYWPNYVRQFDFHKDMLK